jgi:hypothetical protein
MYSITSSPRVALDLAQAVQDEHLRRAVSTRRTAKRGLRLPGGRPHWWPARPWAHRPAVA